MDQSQSPLRGSCSCGRNQYTIAIPTNGAGISIGDTEELSVWFDGGREQRYYHATPLVTPFLRIPLSWYTSHAFPLYPDETPRSIRRTCASSSPFALRHFCGYCGTPISYWRESPAREKDFISITLGSLWGSDVRVLEEMGVLPGSEEGTEEESEEEAESFGMNKDWFGRMVEGSRLARVVAKQKPSILPHYHHIVPPQSTKSKVRVEWEIMEWSSDDEDVEPTTTTTTSTTTLHSTSKRKIGEITTEGPGGVMSITEVEMVEEGDL